MVPGLGFLYAGLARRKSALTLLWVVVASNAVVIFQWYLWGYSLAFSRSATNGFIGNFAHIGYAWGSYFQSHDHSPYLGPSPD